MKIKIRSSRPLSKAQLAALARRLSPKPRQDAARRYRSFHWGNAPSKASKAKIPHPGRGLYELGRLRAVEYETDKGGEVAIWVHKFSKPYPLLTGIGNRLGPIVGGRATVTARGIEK